MHVRNISKEYRLTNRMDLRIVGRIELPPKEVIEEYRRIIRWFGVNKCQAPWQIATTRVNEKNLVTEVGSAVRHLDGIS